MNNKGVTIITLIVTILVILIFVSNFKRRQMDKAVIRQATYLYQIIRKATNNEIEFYFNKIYSSEEINEEKKNRAGRRR